MTITPLSQRDPRWKDTLLGTSKKTIEYFGCTITAIAMKFGTTPDVINKRMIEIGGYLDGNLVIWKKLEEALPGVKFDYKYYEYTAEVNKTVLENLPALIEVDGSPIGSPRHWVLFIGNKQLIDPWDGQTKSTATYKPLGFVDLSGEFKEIEAKPEPGDSNKCLVPNTPEWRKKYEELVDKSRKYDEFVKAGYKTPEAITSMIDTLKTKNKEQEPIIDINGLKELGDEVAGIGRAGALIKDWAEKTQKGLASLKPTNAPQPSKVYASKVEETGLNWLAKLLGAKLK